jgi:hypothetical protein
MAYPKAPGFDYRGVFFLASAVRYYHLGKAPIWVDEIFSWAVAHLRPSLLISYLYQGNNPPLMGASPKWMAQAHLGRLAIWLAIPACHFQRPNSLRALLLRTGDRGNKCRHPGRSPMGFQQFWTRRL